MALVDMVSIYAPDPAGPVEDVFANPELQTRTSLYSNITTEDAFADPVQLQTRLSLYGYDAGPVPTEDPLAG